MPLTSASSSAFSLAVKVLPPPENVTVPHVPSYGITEALVEALGFGDALGEGEDDGEASAEGVGVGATGIGCFDGFGVGNTFFNFVMTMSHAHGDAVGDGVDETVGEGVGVGVALFVAVGVGVGVGVGVAAVVAAPAPGQVCDRRMPEFNDGLSSA